MVGLLPLLEKPQKAFVDGDHIKLEEGMTKRASALMVDEESAGRDRQIVEDLQLAIIPQAIPSHNAEAVPFSIHLADDGNVAILATEAKSTVLDDRDISDLRNLVVREAVNPGRGEPLLCMTHSQGDVDPLTVHIIRTFATVDTRICEGPCWDEQLQG